MRWYNRWYSYNPSLSARRTEATDWGANFFISIHSNAATEGTATNYLYLALSGHSGVSTTVQEKQRKTAVTSWPYVFEFMGEGLNGYNFEPHSHYTYTNMKIAGQSLGVMRHSIQGYLSEGFFHTYQPSRHRALNKDWCRQEGVRYYRGIAAHYGVTGAAADSKGYIMGVVKNGQKKMTKSATLSKTSFYYADGSHDQYVPCNGAVVHLYKGTEKIKSYTVDGNYNGVFVFEDLEPGTYTLDVQCAGFTNIESKYRTVTVKANATTYPIILMKEGTYDPDADFATAVVKGIYAYGLKLTTATDSYTFAFTANDKPESAALVFYKDGAEVGRKAIASPVNGANSVTLAKSDIPGTVGDVLTWGVELNGKAIANWDVLKTESGYTRAFNTVDNSPESDYFGRIYVADRTGKSTTTNGFYAYNQAWERTSSTPYRGGETTWGNPTRPAVAPDGSLFVADWADAHSGVWVAAPGAVSGTYTRFFAGTMNSSGAYSNGGVYTGSGTPGVHIYGTGADTKLIVYNEDAYGSLPANGVVIYNIGNADGSIKTTWTTAPSKVIALTGQDNTEGNVWGTSHGFFVSQAVGSSISSTRIALLFYDYNGTQQFTSTGFADITGNAGGGYAVSRDEKTLIWNDASGNFIVFDITWNGNKPTLTKKTTYNHGLSDIRQMNFDYAGNLIVSGLSGFYIYSVPTTTNKTTTPAKKALTVIAGGGESTTEPDPEDPGQTPEELPTGTITFKTLWSKTTTDAAYLNTGSSDNRSMACYDGAIYIPNKAASTFSVIDASNGSLRETQTLGTSVFGHHNLRITADGKMLLGNTNAGTKESAAVTVLGSDIAIGGQTTLGTATLGGRSDFFYTYGEWNQSGYIIAMTNEYADTTLEHLDMAFVKIPFANGSLQTASAINVRNATLPISYASAKAIPLDDKRFLASAVGVAPTLHDVETGDFVDDWGSEKPAQESGHPTSGAGVFTIHGHTYVVAPLNRYGKFEIYDVSNGLSQATKVTEVGTVAEIGRTKANSLATVDIATEVSGNDVFIYVFAPHNGLSAHKFTFTPDEVSTPDPEPTVPDVTYGSLKFYYQGGTLDVPADNEALWTAFKADYITYYNERRSDQPMANATTFMTQAQAIMTDATSTWKWLGDYLAPISAAKDITLTTDAQWRYAISHFLNCTGTRTDWPATVSFEAEGKPEAWKPFYTLKHQPTKSGDTFLGWYDNAKGNGSPLTALPTSGSVYACWKSGIATDVESVDNMSTVCVLPTFTGVEILFAGTKQVAIYNVNGMMVAGGTSTDYFACDLQSGMYIIRVGNEVYKFVK